VLKRNNIEKSSYKRDTHDNSGVNGS